MITGASQVALVVKNPPANAGDARGTGLIPGSGRSPGGGRGNPLWYSCLENPTDRGAWQDIIHGVTKGWTHKRLSTHASSWLWNCRREKEWTGLSLPLPPPWLGQAGRGAATSQRRTAFRQRFLWPHSCEAVNDAVKCVRRRCISGQELAQNENEEVEIFSLPDYACWGQRSRAEGGLLLPPNPPTTPSPSGCVCGGE